MIKTEKIKSEKIEEGDKLRITLDISHEIGVDNCFSYYALNTASQTKELVMEMAGKAYEDYVKSLAKESDINYLNREFSYIKLVSTFPEQINKTELKTNDINDVGEFIVRYLNLFEINVHVKKLQKLLYFMQAWHLVYFDKHPLFEDKAEAWVSGPIYRTIYKNYEHEKSSDIILSHTKEKYEECLNRLELTKEQQEFMKDFLLNFGLKSLDELTLRAHSQFPFQEARKNSGFLEYKDEVISHEVMYEYYSKLLKK